MAKVRIDKEKCIGCGTCAGLFPKIFKMDDEGRSEVIDQNADEASIKEAIGSCPADAISSTKE